MPRVSYKRSLAPLKSALMLVALITRQKNTKGSSMLSFMSVMRALRKIEKYLKSFDSECLVLSDEKLSNSNSNYVGRRLADVVSQSIVILVARDRKRQLRPFTTHMTTNLSTCQGRTSSR